VIANVLRMDGGRSDQKYRVVRGIEGKRRRNAPMPLAFQANERFEVVGVCDIDARLGLDAAAARFGAAQGHGRAPVVRVPQGPDIFCFCTLPNLRSEMVRAGIDGGAASDRV